MTDPDDTREPYDPTITPEERSDILIGALYLDPDPIRRSRTVALLAERLPDVRAITIKQVEIELGSINAAATALGISRQAIDEAYRRAELPGPRADTGRNERAAYRYGRLLAVCEQIAVARDELSNRANRRADRNVHRHRWDKLHRGASQSTTYWPALARAVGDWLSSLPQPERWTVRIDELVPSLADLPTGYLSLPQQADVVLGFHHERAEARTPAA